MIGDETPGGRGRGGLPQLDGELRQIGFAGTLARQLAATSDDSVVRRGPRWISGPDLEK